jgi:hypothetical protein
MADNGNDRPESEHYLQEVPRVNASHCRAWDCAITRLARSPIIGSQDRFALKGGRNMYGEGMMYRLSLSPIP